MLPERNRSITCSIQPSGYDKRVALDPMEVDPRTFVVDDVPGANAAGQRSDIAHEDDLLEMLQNQVLRIYELFVHQVGVGGEPAQLRNQASRGSTEGECEMVSHVRAEGFEPSGELTPTELLLGPGKPYRYALPPRFYRDSLFISS